MKNGRLSDEGVTKPDRFRHAIFLHRFARLFSVLALSLFLHALSLDAATLPPGFTEEQYGGTLNPGSPTAMAFSPDGLVEVYNIP